MLNFLQNLMHWVSEYNVDYLRIGGSELPCKVLPRSVVVVKLVRLEVPPLLGDNHCLTFPLQLVLLHSFVFVNSVYKLVYDGDRLASQGFP